MFISVRDTLHLYVFAAECDPLGLMCLDALLADVDLLAQHPPLFNDQHFFHDRNNRRVILLTYGHGAIHHTLHRHARDGLGVAKAEILAKWSYVSNCQGLGVSHT
jgi:hypothetical protein